jgi:hypothetical protein
MRSFSPPNNQTAQPRLNYSRILVYEAVSLGKWFPTFRRNTSRSSSRVQGSSTFKTLHDEGDRFLQHVGNNPSTQHHMHPEEQNPRLHRCGNRRTRTNYSNSLDKPCNLPSSITYTSRFIVGPNKYCNFGGTFSSNTQRLPFRPSIGVKEHTSHKSYSQLPKLSSEVLSAVSMKNIVLQM